MKYNNRDLDVIHKLKGDFINSLIGMNVDYGVCMLMSTHMNMAFSVMNGGADTRWAKVSDEMPSPSTRLMFYDPDTDYKWHLGTFHEGRNAFVRHDGQILHNVTHWKELNEPYKKRDK